MQKISKAVNTSRTLRASIEFCLGAFRSNIEIATFTEATQQTCFCCGVLEKYNSINETGRNPIFHLLFDGAPARFLRNYLKNYARRILDQSFDITLSAIIFNEVPFHIVKRCDNQSLRRWFTLINIFKTTLYALYYRRPLFDRSGSIIIRTFNHHLRAAKKAATERCSDILDKITFIAEKNFQSFLFTKSLTKYIMTQHHIDGKTIKISAFSQIIAKDSQGVKTLKGSKTPQKYLNKKDNFWLKMHSREVTTWPTYRKLKGSTYVKKCKSIPTMFTSNYNPLQLTQWRPKPCYVFSLSLCNQSMSLYLFLPPLPHISHHFTTTFFSKT